MGYSFKTREMKAKEFFYRNGPTHRHKNTVCFTESDVIKFAEEYAQSRLPKEGEMYDSDMASIKLKWQKHNRDNGLSWNEVAELVNEVWEYKIQEYGG